MTTTTVTAPAGVDLTTLTLALFAQTAGADSFERGGHLVTVTRDDDSGKFGDDGLADAITTVTEVFGRQTVAGQSVAAFNDPEGNFLDEPGKGVAFRDVEEMGAIEDDGDVAESNYFPAGQAAQVADAIAAAAAAARSDGTIGGLQRRANIRAAGIDIAAFHDGDGIWGDPETRYVAMSYQGGEVDWDAPNLAEKEGLRYTLFDPEEADDLADAIRATAAAAPAPKTGLPRRIDRLGLDGLLPLDAGERLTASAAVDTLHSTEFQPVLAATQGLSGPQLRVGVQPSEDRDWIASDDGSTAVLDAAGFAELQQVMADLPARANAQRAQFARDTLNPAQKRVDELTARKEAIQDRVYEGDISPAQLEKIHQLQERADSYIRSSDGWAEYVDSYRKTAALQHKYMRQEGDQLYSEPMSADDRAEYDRLRARIATLHDSDPWIPQIDRLHQEIHNLGVGSSTRELTTQEKDEVNALNDQIRAIQASVPDVDDLMFAGRVNGAKWGDLRYEVHGLDDWDEDNIDGANTWRLRLSVIPPGAPLDHENDPSWQEIDIYPDEIAKTMRAFRKVFDTTGSSQTAAVRRPVTVETVSIRQIADIFEIPYELLRGHA